MSQTHEVMNTPRGYESKDSNRVFFIFLYVLKLPAFAEAVTPTAKKGQIN